MFGKSRSYEESFLTYTVQRTEYFVILDHFYPLTLLTTQKIKILTKWKNTWRYHFTQVYHKWQPYDMWFLRYEVHQTEFFCHPGPSFALLPPPPLPLSPNSLKNKNFKKMRKNTWRYHHVTQVYQKSWSEVILFMRYDMWRM